VLDGNFALGCGPGTDYPYIHIFQCMLERTDAIMNEVLEPIMFVLAHPTVYDSQNKSPSFPDSINWLVFVVDREYVLCQEQAQFL